jgi:hypothetical protein
MIAANTAIFNWLDEYCASHDVEIKNVGAARWIQTEPPDRKILRDAKAGPISFFTPSKRIARFDYNSDAYFCTVGFEGAELETQLAGVELNGALVTLILAELKPRPIATPNQVRNVVEVSDKGSDEEYKGHDFDAIAGLYASMLVQVAADIDKDETWNIFFQICLMDTRKSHSWIARPLIDTLQSLCGLGLANIPFQTLCRSIFDSDPAALFLALYRCMEGIYAYSSAIKVKVALGLNNDWTTIAGALEDELNWHPHEEGSLASLMSYALQVDMANVFDALSESAPALELLTTHVARRIYRLRNSLVHYRPSNQQVEFNSVDWNKLCIAMANIVCDTYAGVFTA